MLVVTHADLVAAAATLLPGNRDISHVQPGALLMASRIRPMGPGDAWSVVSSERSDEQSESKVVKFLSRAQGWKVESFHIEFCPTHRTRENVVKRMVASLRKFTAKSKLGEDKVRYLLKAFSGDRRRRKRSLCISPPPGGPLGPDPAYWVFSCEAGDPLDRMPPQVSRAWCGTSPRSSPRSSPRASPRFPPKLPVPGQAPASSSATRLMGMSDEKPKTLRALVSMTNFSTSAGSLVHSSGAQSSGELECERVLRATHQAGGEEEGQPSQQLRLREGEEEGLPDLANGGLQQRTH
ncbi:unnamed protein product [Effrenium voratum]|nr:unnamed protein product [Effrenium voratum]